MNTPDKVTEWFPVNVKPARPGVYERNFGADDAPECVYCYWTGRSWLCSGDSIQEAMSAKEEGLQFQPWRGLAFDPKKDS